MDDLKTTVIVKKKRDEMSITGQQNSGEDMVNLFNTILVFMGFIETTVQDLVREEILSEKYLDNNDE